MESGESLPGRGPADSCGVRLDIERINGNGGVRGVKETNLFCTADRQEWREWLLQHFETEKEVWLVFPVKASGEAGLSYNDAVEEALCFGWIDSTIRHIDPLHRAQRFTPRNPKSSYSRPNIERLIRLDAQGLIHPKVRPSVEGMIHAAYVFPGDIIDTLRRDPAVWEHFVSFPEPYKRIRVAYIDAARKRPEEFRKRLDFFIRKTRENRLIIGYGGICRYYGNPDGSGNEK